ncbi:Bromodomain-containing protein [Cladophialophora immunda]|nr:Bromodomain-containing protein [Cladophialophora immunda]
MPSLKAYTPYETLAFCQSVACHGSDTAAFEGIATALNANQLIRDSETYDQTRLTAAALQGLYHELLVEERNAQTFSMVNGDNGPNGTNPRKRKLSTSPAPSPAATRGGDGDEQRILQALVDKLYARFREQTIKEIRQEEEDYLRLQAEIAELEKAEDLNNKQQTDTEETKRAQVEPPKTTAEAIPKPPAVESSTDAAAAALPANLEVNRTEQLTSSAAAATPAPDAEASPTSVRSSLHQPVAPARSPAPSTPTLAPKVSTDSASIRPSQPPQAHPHLSPGAFHRTLPVPSPQRPNYGAINPQHFQPGPQGQPVPVLPQYAGSPHMPPPAEFPPQKRGSSASGQGRGSPIPMQSQQPYPGYAGYPQQPPWPHHMPPQYAQPPPYPNSPYYMQSPPGRPTIPYQTPHHPGYAPYPQSAPIHYQGQSPHPQIWPSPQPGQPYYGYPGSANVTPVPRSDSRQALPRGRSSTPWKRRSQVPVGVRPSSPTRPEREVSPLTDTESPTRRGKVTKSPGKADHKAEESSIPTREVAQTARGRQATSATPSAFAGSRSQSLASFTSDTPTDRRKKGGQAQKIKAEPPSTPVPIPSDTEQPPQRTGTRRGRPRTTTATTKADLVQPAAATNKRKRSLDRDSATPPASLVSQLPSPATTAATRMLSQPSVHRQLSASMSHDPSLVCVSRSFAKTAQLLLNDLVSHKLASIFAKPLSERDAPGYKHLVSKPQDLKSIKAAITKGGKAALAAIEAFEERTESKTVGGNEGESEQNSAANATAAATALDGNSTGGERALGNGVYIVGATEDLVPPKGIVNSAQLETELVRMFANAVMFNPLPSSERGFGRSLRLRKRGGDVAPQSHDVDGDRDAGSVESEESDEGSPSEEIGIISDTREMFEDVMTKLKKWKELELERLGNVGAGLNTETEHAAATPVPSALKSTPHAPALGSHSGNGSANVSVVVSANPSLRHSESVEKEDEGAAPSTPAASVTGTARKRRRIADG